MTTLLRALPSLAVAAALAATFSAQAQGPAPAPAAAQAPLPAPDAEKQKVIDRILVAFHPENGILQLVQRQGIEAMQQSNLALQQAQVPSERKDKAMKAIGTDVQKYIDTTMPPAIASAKKNVNPAVGPILAQNFTVDELRQIAAMLESPLKQKFEKLVPQMESAVAQKVQAEVSPQVNQNVKTMTDAVRTELRSATTVQK